MTVAPQVAMRKASQMWQVFFPSQTLHVFFFLSQNLQIFGLALRKKAQYVVVQHSSTLCILLTTYIQMSHQNQSIIPIYGGKYDL
jgi:hypothetical protein